MNCSGLKGNGSLAKCEFKTNRISKVTFSGVDITNKRSINDFQLQEGLFLANEIKNQRLKTEVVMELSVRNPNAEAALLQGIQYVLVFDGKEILNEESKYEILVKGNGRQTFSTAFKFNLLDAAKNAGYDTIIQTALGLIDGKNQPASFDLYIRPNIKVNDKKIKYQDFIKLNTLYQSGRTNKSK